MTSLSSKQKYFIYTDASFSLTETLSVSGFIIFHGDLEHEKGITAKSEVQIKVFKEVNNIRAELSGSLFALQKFSELVKDQPVGPSAFEVHLFSDCQTLTNLLRRREKLELKNFLSARKKTALANADLYENFYKIYDLLQPKIHWVKGHTKSPQQNFIEKNFSFLDQSVRKELRNILKS